MPSLAKPSTAKRYPEMPYPDMPNGSRPAGTSRGPRRPIPPWLLPVVALVCVVALVGGGVFWWLNRPSDTDAELLPGQLTGAFPTAPSAAWTVHASDFGGGIFISVLPEASQYLSLGFINDDDNVVALVGPKPFESGNADGTRSLVGIDTRSGKHWVLDKPVKACADAIVDHRTACYDTTTVYFVDTQKGQVIGSTPLAESDRTYGIAYNGDAAYTRKYGDGGLVITKLTSSGTQWAKTIPLSDGFPTGDSSRFTATRALVGSGNGNVVVVSADDGSVKFNQGGPVGIGRLPDGSMAVETGHFVNGSPTRGPAMLVRADGTTAQLGTSVSVPRLAAPNQRNVVLSDGNLVDVAAAPKSRWPQPISASESLPTISLADDREFVLHDDTTVRAVDTATGQVKWTVPTASTYSLNNPGVTDGERMIVRDGQGGVRAVDLSTGTSVWTLDAAALGNVSPIAGNSPSPAQLAAGGDHLVTVTPTTITGFAPTGAAAIVPGSVRAHSGSHEGSGGDSYVTPCGSAPVFTPQRYRTESGGLVVTMKVTATCPSGDVLAGPQTTITLRDGSSLVAGGVFDFSRSPVGVPHAESAADGISIDLTFPPGSFSRLPDTLGASSSSGSSGSSGTSGTGGREILVECSKGPTTAGSPTRIPVASSTASALTATTPAGADRGASAGDALRTQANSDRAFILANLNNRWVAQLSSKRPGLVAEGRTWDDQAILDEFLASRLRFSDVRLLWSDEWSVFSYSGWWVTVAANTFPGPDDANTWCRTQGFDPDHCFAKMISTSAGPEGSTLYWH